MAAQEEFRAQREKATPTAKQPAEAAETEGDKAPVKGFREDTDALDAPGGEAFSYVYEGEREGGKAAAEDRATTLPDRTVVELPELVYMARGLLQGKYPTVPKRLRGQAIGRFRAGASRSGAAIELQADIFIGPVIRTGIVKGDPAIIARVTEQLMAQVLEQYPNLTPQDIEVRTERARGQAGQTRLSLYRLDPEFAANVLAHEIGHLTDWLPDADLRRGNVLGRIASLKNYLAHTLEEYPESAEGALAARERRTIRRRAAQELSGQMFMNKQDKNDAIAERYRELIDEEIQARGLWVRDEIMAELKGLTQWWSNWDEATASDAYINLRFSGKELYAEALSVLLNKPQELEARAPKFNQAFFNYLENKPEVRQLYEDIVRDIRSGANKEQRVARLREGFARGDEKHQADLERPRTRVSEALAALKVLFVDAHAAVKGKATEARRAGLLEAAKNPEYKIEDAAYSGAEAEYYLSRVRNEVRKGLESVGLDPSDLGEYMFHLRVINERGKMANPQGWTPKASQERITEMERQLGPVKWPALERIRKAFWGIRSETVNSKAIEVGIFSDELLALFKDNEFYATFDVVKYIDQKYGRGSGAHIYQQIGTLSDITDPFTATVMKDIALMRAINWNEAKRSSVDMLLDHFADEVEEADKKWVGDHHEYKESTDPEKGLVLFLHEGKMQGYYVSRAMADSFKNDDPRAVRIAAGIVRALATPFRAIFTSLRPGFQVFNVFRDFKRMRKNLSGMNTRRGIRYWVRAVKPAFRSVFGIPDAVAQEVMRGRMLLSIADIAGQTSEERHIEHLLRMYIGQGHAGKNKVLKPFRALLHAWLRVGESIERTPKIAAWLYLKENTELADEEIAHIVRTQAGSPSFITKGKWTGITNNIFLFSNPFIQAWRTDLGVARDKPAMFAYKVARYALLPKAIQWGLASGALVSLLKLMGRDDDDDDVKWAKAIQGMYQNIGEYDMTNYNCIPLGVTPQGKTVYFRVPQDEGERFFGGVFWKLMNMKRNGIKTMPQILDYTAGQMPGMNPAFDIAATTYTYLSGRNPYDSFRGRLVIPEQLFTAKNWETHKAFLKYLANESGAGIVYRFRQDEPIAVQSEIEKLINAPVVSDILGRFLRVTDRGQKELIREAIEDERQTRARELVRLRQIAKKQVEGKELTVEEQSAVRGEAEYLRARRKIEKGRGLPAAESMLLQARTRAEKRAARQRIRELQTPAPK